MARTERPPCVILAGGAGRRIGGDKAFAELAGQPLIAHVAARLTPQCAALAINSNADPGRYATLAADAVIADASDSARGPLDGVLAALLWAEGQGARHVLTAPVDTPFLPRDLAARLSAVDAAIVLAATADGVHGTCGLWDTALADDLTRALDSGLRKVTEWTTRHDAATVTFPAATPPSFFNVNTPDDLARAERLLAAR